MDQYSNGSSAVLLLKIHLYKESCHSDLATREREKREGIVVVMVREEGRRALP
jgi:hypothetical protein